MSYQDLADKTGLSKSTLQRYETGNIKNMPLDKLKNVADALSISPSYIMGWEQQVTNEIKKVVSRTDIYIELIKNYDYDISFTKHKVTIIDKNNNAYEANRMHSLNEMASFLEVTPEFLNDVLRTYKAKYGTHKELDNYVIFFDPTIAVLERFGY